MSLPDHDNEPAAAAGKDRRQQRQREQHEQGEGGARRARSRLVRELVWRRVDVPGIEYFRLWESAAGPRLTGTVILADGGLPWRLKYAVACAPDWTTRGVHVALTRGAVTRHVKLTSGDSAGSADPADPADYSMGRRWRRGLDEAPRRAGGQQQPPGAAADLAVVAGCLDVDLAFTPSTNILPLRRLGLAAGESREVTAAWLRFPELTVEPLPQRYTRLDERRVLYESRGGAFTAELEVDELGLVVRYPPLWERVAVGPDGR
ncbi:MAG TPA: putative glycolipid-binding domain-containing protein [Thermoanaerobaculia bacterium]|jgi:hypothetical protein|nr:putative glycolipid-binding domain-containing protein [Thermoanaerobaculia bacterium]